MNYTELFSNLLILIRELICSSDFLEEFRVPKHFVRKGKITLENMVYFLMFHSKSSLEIKLDRFREQFPEREFPFVSKQALSKARYGVRFELFQTLLEMTADFYYENVSKRKLWKGKYHLFAVDGSRMEVPSSESTFDEFGKFSDEKNPKLFWSMALSSSIYDVLEDIIIHATIEKLYSSEREMSRQHLARFIDLGLQINSIVIFDRGYYEKELFRLWVENGCQVLMRIKHPNNLCELEGKDVITTIKYSDGFEITCRAIQYVLPTGEIEYLVTNVLDKDITAEMFGELYFCRWKIETKYYEMKEQWKIEEFTGTGALAVRQDFYITMLHANLAAIVKNEADILIDKDSKTTNNYKYQARKAYIINKIYMYFLKWVISSFTQDDIDQMIRETSKKRSQIKTGRSDKRKKHTRAKKHNNNRKDIF